MPGEVEEAKMTSLHRQAWQSNAMLFSNDVEDGVSSTAFDVQLYRTRWLKGGEARFRPSMHFIEMVISSKSLVRGSYSSRGDRADFIPLGDVVFMPQDAVLNCAIEPGSQRSISCMFDADLLASRTGTEWKLPDFHLDDALNIGNEYVRAGLRRIADELVAPSFASVAQIECSLMFIAMEMLRILDRSHETKPIVAGRLTKRQLSRLCSMLVDSIGEPPSLGELAAETGMCGRSLATAFRNTTGETFRSFLAKSRLERAKILLPDRKLLIKQVAYDCGFKNTASFTAAFRKATGMTPGDYRTRVAA